MLRRLPDVLNRRADQYNPTARGGGDHRAQHLSDYFARGGPHQTSGRQPQKRADLAADLPTDHTGHHHRALLPDLRDKLPAVDLAVQIPLSRVRDDQRHRGDLADLARGSDLLEQRVSAVGHHEICLVNNQAPGASHHRGSHRVLRHVPCRLPQGLLPGRHLAHLADGLNGEGDESAGEGFGGTGGKLGSHIFSRVERDICAYVDLGADLTFNQRNFPFLVKLRIPVQRHDQIAFFLLLGVKMLRGCPKIGILICNFLQIPVCQKCVGFYPPVKLLQRNNVVRLRRVRCPGGGVVLPVSRFHVELISRRFFGNMQLFTGHRVPIGPFAVEYLFLIS